jgi:hypothetical protein
MTAQHAGAPALRPYVGCLSGQPPNFTHARTLTHEHGMVQFALGDRIHLEHGYCLDDNARAFLAALLALQLRPEMEDALFVGAAALAHVERCRREDGRFHNLMAEDGSFLDEVGSQESFGRTVWAAGVGACCAPLVDWRERSEKLLAGALPLLHELQDLRPKAYAVLGLAAALRPQVAAPGRVLASLPPELEARVRTELISLAHQLHRHLERAAEPEWEWWEPLLTWGNARPPEALLRAAAALDDPKLAQAGLRALGFLAQVTHPHDTFIPIGNKGWYERGSERAIHDQQPIEACGMVDVWIAASKCTGRMDHAAKALAAFGWFFGENTERVVMVTANGGCQDGLEPSDVNENLGAESTLSYLHAHAALALFLKEKHVANEFATTT